MAAVGARVALVNPGFSIGGGYARPAAGITSASTSCTSPEWELEEPEPVAFPSGWYAAQPCGSTTRLPAVWAAAASGRQGAQRPARGKRMERDGALVGYSPYRSSLRGLLCQNSSSIPAKRACGSAKAPPAVSTIYQPLRREEGGPGSSGSPAVPGPGGLALGLGLMLGSGSGSGSRSPWLPTIRGSWLHGSHRVSGVDPQVGTPQSR